MTWQLISLAQVPATPWRNGGGRTRELLAWPRSEDWSWRISVAEVASSGPFSHFDGVQRWLAILRGAGVRLEFPDQTVDLSADSAPLAFSGDETVECQLLDGAIQDLNLMVRVAGAGRAELSQMQRVRGSVTSTINAAQTQAVYALDTPVLVSIAGAQQLVPPETLAWRTAPSGAQLRIEAQHALWMQISV